LLECAAFLDLLLLIDHGYASPPPSSSIRPAPDQLSPASRIVSGIGALLDGRGVSVIRRWLGSTRPGCLAVTEKITPAMAAETIAEPPRSRQVLPLRCRPPMKSVSLSFESSTESMKIIKHGVLGARRRQWKRLQSAGRQEGRQEGRQADRQTDRQTDRQRNRECVIPIARWRLSNLGLVWHCTGNWRHAPDLAAILQDMGRRPTGTRCR